MASGFLSALHQTVLLQGTVTFPAGDSIYVSALPALRNLCPGDNLKEASASCLVGQRHTYLPLSLDCKRKTKTSPCEQILLQATVLVMWEDVTRQE
jgi:hypothetical protein